MILALIPAAGKSTRMGRPKLALPLGTKSVLEHVISALRQGGVEETLVVVGPHVSELVPLAESAGAHTLLLQHETPDMRSTIEHGLRHLEDRFHPKAEAFWLLSPADHPTLAPATVRQLVQARCDNPSFSIFIPTFQSQRGHPTLLTWDHAAKLQSFLPNRGVNSYLRHCCDATYEVAVSTAEVLCDVDTPEEYARLKQGWDR